MSSRAPITRRRFITGTILSAAALRTFAAQRRPHISSSGELRATEGLTDVNVSLFHWPMRRLPYDETAALRRKLISAGVTQAWAGSFEALLHRDMSAVNARLTEACRADARRFWLPFGSINPKAAGWQEDLRRCLEEHRMPGIRVYPGYHDYTLSEPAFVELLDDVLAARMVLQLVVSLEDTRVQHPRMRAAPVDLKPLPDLLAARPGLKLVLLNWSRAGSAGLVPSLAARKNVMVDIATLEGAGGLETLLKQIPRERVLFGSHAPFYYFESALLKLRESEVTGETLAAIGHKNAAGMLRAG